MLFRSRMLNETSKNALSSLNALNMINEEIAVRRTLIQTLNGEINILDSEHKKLTKDISELEKDLELKKTKYGEAMKSIYSKRSGIDEVVFVLSAQNFTQTWRRMRYLKEYSDWRKRQANEIMIKQTLLAEKKSSLEKKRVEIGRASCRERVSSPV